MSLQRIIAKVIIRFAHILVFEQVWGNSMMKSKQLINNNDILPLFSYKYNIRGNLGLINLIKISATVEETQGSLVLWPDLSPDGEDKIRN